MWSQLSSLTPADGTSRKAAIYCQNCTRHETCFLGGKEDRRRGNVAWFSKTVDGNVPLQFSSLIAGVNGPCEFGYDRAGRNGVSAHARSRASSENSSKRFDSRLRRRIWGIRVILDRIYKAGTSGSC